jgi:hypothetical protein
MHLYPINGAAGRVAKGDTAFSFREARFAEVVVGVDPDLANNPRLVQWAGRLALRARRAAAISMMMDGDNEERAATARRGEEVRPGPVPGRQNQAGEAHRAERWPGTISVTGGGRQHDFVTVTSPGAVYTGATGVNRVNQMKRIQR